MVCVYCGYSTRVINSRQQLRSNQVWRRRKCESCGSIFTTHEIVDFSTSFSVKNGDELAAFEYNRILAELLMSLRHRNNVYLSATELAATITRNLIKNASQGLILASDVEKETAKVLKRYDHRAWLRYVADHPSLEG